MRLKDYLEESGESQVSFAARASVYVEGGIKQRTVSRAVRGEGIQARAAYGIIQASVDQPTLTGGTVTLRDLVVNSEEPKSAA